jgi:hypothetical protein
MAESPKEPQSFNSWLGVGTFVLTFVMLVVLVLHERDHDHTDYTGVAVTVGLLALLLLLNALAVIRNWRGANRAKGLRAQIVTIKEEAELQKNALEKRLAEALLLIEKPAAQKGPSRLVIHYARYEAIDGSGDDVAEFLRGIITGDSLVLDIENHSFVIGERNFVPKDPKPSSPKWLRVEYSYDRGPKCFLQRPEHSRLVLPEDSFLKEQTTIALEPDQNEIKKQNRLHELGRSVDGLLSPLQVEILRLRQNIVAWSLTIPPCPAPDGSVNRDNADPHAAVLCREIADWTDKIHHQYASTYEPEVMRLAHKLGALGVKVRELEADSTEVASPDTVAKITNDLQKLAWEVEGKAS